MRTRAAVTRLILLATGLLCPTVAGLARADDHWPPEPPLPLSADREPGQLPDSVTTKPLSDGHWQCTFQYTPDSKPETVMLAGTFNNWSRDAMPLSGPAADGRWSATVDLPAGVYLYKFVVDGDRWLPDPKNQQSVPDGHSGQNSVLRLGYIAQLRESPAKLGDSQIETRALEHRSGQSMYFQRIADQEALFRLRTLSHDVEQVYVSVEGVGETKLTITVEGEPFALWEGVARISPPGQCPAGVVRYTFVLSDGEVRGSSPETYGVDVSATPVFHTPDWAKNAIWYQVFLDRFRNGDPSNDRQPVSRWTSEWFAPSPFEKEREAKGDTFYKYYVFDRQYGGDIEGLEQKLPYLKELGVNAIYLNPIFKAESNHKYNAESYIHVDDHFGTLGDYDQVAPTEDLTDPKTWKWTETDKRFLAFVKKAHAEGFKVIIDGVFNHVGTAHLAFQDVKKNGQKSKYADWFEITSWEPFKYEGWFGHDALPVFRKSKDGLASAGATKHIFDVTRRWMDPDGDGDPSDGIDGWRLDVPNEIPAPFWVNWRELVKSINPNAYISGEIWDRADSWLDGTHFDAVMNYEFARPVVAWLFNIKQKIAPSELDRRLRELRLAYPREATLVLQNLLDSHDTDRVASMARNPDRAYDNANRVQDNGPKYDNSKPSPAEYQKARLAALVQMTYVGAPMVYYGDEAGMWGSDDPTCRKPMLWADLEPYDQPEENFVMKDQLAYYRQIIALRREHPALRTGSFQTLLADDQADVWAFLRKDAEEQLIVVLNAGNQERTVSVPLPASAANRWKGIFGAEGMFQAVDQKLEIRVPAVGGVVLHVATPR